MIPGWLKLHRQITEWEWYSDAKVSRVFLHLLLTVNWKAGRFKGMEIPVGARFTSYDTLADETGLSNHQVRTAIDKLKSTGELATFRAMSGLMVTVCKYATYNGDFTEERQPIGRENGNEVAMDWQCGGNEVATIEEGKKDKNLKESKKKKGGEPPAPLVIPEEWSAPLKEAMQTWLAYKVEKRSPYKPIGWSQLCQEVNKYPEAVIIRAAQRAMSRNWAGMRIEDEIGTNQHAKSAPGPDRNTGTANQGIKFDIHQFDSLHPDEPAPF